MELQLSIEGRDGDRQALWEWLKAERDLRGRVRVATAAPAEGTMGGISDIAVHAAAGAAGAGAVWVALSRSLSTWLINRRADVTIEITTPDGRTLRVDSKRVDQEKLLRAVRALVEQTSER